jgi:MFS family permease
MLQWLLKTDCLDIISFTNGLVFFAPIALLVRTKAGIDYSAFFLLQTILALTILLLEIPSGIITDKIGYKKTIVISQLFLFLARVLLFLAFYKKAIVVFICEAIIEGIFHCFTSGTISAYIYNRYGNDNYLQKKAKTGNWWTFGFLISTITYSFIYKTYDIHGLLLLTIFFDFLGCLMTIFLTETFTITSDNWQIIKSFSNKMILTIAFATSGLLVLLFGLVKQAGIILSIMIIMPLSFNLPEYLLSKITNERIDAMGEKNKRATILSIVNMGNNCMSIIFLFLSSQLIKYGVRNYCLVYGSILVILSIYGIFEDGLSSERGKCKW